MAGFRGVAIPALSSTVVLLGSILLASCSPAPIYTDRDVSPVVRPPAPTMPASAEAGETLTGFASYYGDAFRGRPTASGEIFNPSAMTAAHKTLPFGTRLRVTLVATGESVEVTVNDRGPFVNDRILDLSEGAAERIGLTEIGVGYVEARILERGGS